MEQARIFGSLHVDRPQKVTNELQEFAEDSDVLFIESPREESRPSEERKLLIRNPTIFLVGVIVDWFWGIPGLVLTGQFQPVDRVATNRVAESNDIDIEPVDLNLVKRAAEVHPVTSICSWLWLTGASVVFIHGIYQMSFGFLTLSLALSFLPVLPLVYTTLGSRDRVMAENIREILESRESADKGCLVVGRDHTEGVAEHLKAEGVEVDDVHKSLFVRRSL